MLIPENPSEERILALMRYHETGAQFYDSVGQTKLAEWSRQKVWEWSEKLKALRAATAQKHQALLEMKPIGGIQ